MNDEELNSLREPKDLNDPGDIYSFIEGKSLPWPSAAIDNFNALHNNNGCPEINGNVIYILSKKLLHSERHIHKYLIYEMVFLPRCRDQATV